MALKLIDLDLAYVDDSTSEEIAAQKGTPTTPGKRNQYADRSPAENRTLFEENWIDLTVNKSPQAKKCETVNEWSELTKVIDYLKQVFLPTIV